MRQDTHSVGVLVVAALLGVSLTARMASARPRRYVAVPLEDVQLIREVRQAGPPAAPAAPRHHHHHRNHQQAAAPVPRYEEPQAAATSFEAEGTEGTAYDAGFAPEPEQARNRFERQSGGGGGDDHEYVDYGAHTGHHGAFGWYADFPVLSKGHRRR